MASKPKMPIYRPVTSRLWNDRRFLSLSDSGKLLWLFMLTAPALPIPGVVIGGEAWVAEQLGWTVDRVHDGFAEIGTAGINVRWQGRVIWLVNATKHQPCAGPNAVRCWAGFWDDIPDTQLKLDLWQALKISSKRWSKLFAELFPEPLPEPFAEPFAEPFGEPLPEPLPKGSPTRNTKHQTPNTSEREEIRSAPPPLELPDSLSAELPDGWEPEWEGELAEVRGKLEARGVDVEDELIKFRADMRAHGIRTRNPRASLIKWLLHSRSPSAAEIAAREEAMRTRRRQQQRIADKATPNVVELTDADREELAAIARAAVTNGFQEPRKATG